MVYSDLKFIDQALFPVPVPTPAYIDPVFVTATIPC